MFVYKNLALSLTNRKTIDKPIGKIDYVIYKYINTSFVQKFINYFIFRLYQCLLFAKLCANKYF